LYGALLRNPGIACCTVQEALDACPRRGKIRRLHAGSWIRGDFSTWIGGPEKNQAWTILGRVRSELSAALEDPRTPGAQRAAAWASLRAAEGSDWFWWLDGQFASLHRLQFDQVFRGHLRQAYEALGRASPEFLTWPIPRPEAEGPDAGAWEPPDGLSPVLDGFEGDYFEWEGAVAIPWSRLSSASTQERARGLLDSLRFAFSREGKLLLRMDPPPASGPRYFAGLRIVLSFKGEEESARRITVDLDQLGDLKEVRIEMASKAGAPEIGRGASAFAAAARKILEMAVPFGEAGLHPGERVVLRIQITRGDETVTLREIDLRVPSFSSRARNWSAL
jgi:hypothetical protein